MPARPPDVVEFHEQRRWALVVRMVGLATSGAGWVNLSPGLDVDVPPPGPSPLASLFGSRGPTVPLGTWAPAPRPDAAASVGIRHGRGPRAIGRLAARHVTVPAGWRVVQDHPKRGLVLAVPPRPGEPGPAGGGPGTTLHDDLDTVLRWLLRATAALCPVPRTGEWRAEVHER
ncbi:MAG TPA: hypothetical protein VFW63_12390 [Acidimicrobiales bacterium]|nr:hypothetical protein [Acidimicrobiales bacterium]